MEYDEKAMTADEATRVLAALLDRYVETARYVGDVKAWQETPATEESEDEPEA